MVDARCVQEPLASGPSTPSQVSELQVDELAPLDELTLYTSNTRYDIIVLSPSTATVLLKGGRLFPDFIPTNVAGSAAESGDIVPRGICVGSPVVFRKEDGQHVVTSRVRAIEHTHSDGRHDHDGCMTGSVPASAKGDLPCS